LLLSNGARIASALVINRHLAHFGDDKAYAVWAVAQSAVLSVTVVSDFGLSAVGPRELTHLGNGSEVRRKFVGEMLGLKLFTTIAAAAVCSMLLLYSPITRGNVQLVILAAAATFGWGLCAPWYFIVSHRSVIYYLAESLCFALYSALVLIFVRSPQDFSLGYGAMALIWGALGIWTFKLILRDEAASVIIPKSPTSFIRALSKRFSSFLIVLFPALSSSALVYFLGFRLTAQDMSRYALADRIQGAVVYGASPLIQSIAPLFSERSRLSPNSLKKLSAFASSVLVIGSIFCVLTFDSMASHVLKFMAGSASQDATTLLRIIMWITVPMVVNSMIKNWVYIPRGNYHMLNIMSVVFCAVNLSTIILAPNLDAIAFAKYRILIESLLASTLIVASLYKGRALATR
jgi:hypothetical protein